MTGMIKRKTLCCSVVMLYENDNSKFLNKIRLKIRFMMFDRFVSGTRDGVTSNGVLALFFVFSYLYFILIELNIVLLIRIFV